jgi:hypothetical protein
MGTFLGNRSWVGSDVVGVPLKRKIIHGEDFDVLRLIAIYEYTRYP